MNIKSIFKILVAIILITVTINVSSMAMELDGTTAVDVYNTVGSEFETENENENETENEIVDTYKPSDRPTYKSSGIRFEDLDDMSSETDSTGVALTAGRMIGLGITIVQGILVIIGVVLIATAIFKKNSHKVLLSIFAFMSFGASFVLNIIKNFAHKPIIYIYPEEEIEVEVKVSNPEKFTCTYPKYKDSWKVLAKPTGDLVDLETGKKLYSLYWEGLNTTKPNYKEGFIVKGEDITSFLEEKLEILGLNDREKEEFIIYWLPLMEKNRYNFVRFETGEEIKENMDLIITPEPDTLIRINMEFKPLLLPINVVEQKLEKVERKGYTVVEWGGTKL